MKRATPDFAALTVAYTNPPDSAKVMATTEWIEISSAPRDTEAETPKPLKLHNFLPMTFRLYAADKKTVLFELPSEGDLWLKSADQQPVKGRVGSVALDAKQEILAPVIYAQKFTALDEKSPGYKAFTEVPPNEAILVSLPCAKFLAESPNIVLLSPIYTSASGPNHVVRNEKRDIVGTTNIEYHPRHSIVL